MPDPNAADLVPVPDRRPAGAPAPLDQDRRIALVDLLDRVLAGGVVLRGELSLGIADVELVRVSLRAVVASVSALTNLDEDDDPEETSQ